MEAILYRAQKRFDQMRFYKEHIGRGRLSPGCNLLRGNLIFRYIFHKLLINFSNSIIFTKI